MSLILSTDPCRNVFCTKGRMCVVNEDRTTRCVCPDSCPDKKEPVCSVYLREFSNACELHKFACRIGIMMGIERKGKCDVKGVLTSLLQERRQALCEKSDFSKNATQFFS